MSLHPGQDNVCSGVSYQTSTGLNYSIATGGLEALSHVVQIAMRGYRTATQRAGSPSSIRIYVLWILLNAFSANIIIVLYTFQNLCYQLLYTMSHESTTNDCLLLF